MSSKEDTKPNILWICADMLRFDVIGSLGNPHINTPNMDSLVAEGVSFTRAYCQSSICTPSRSSFLTGKYPFVTGVVGNGNEYFPAGERLVTKTLSDQGYDCGLVGKLHLSAIFQPPEKLANGGCRHVGPRVEPRPDDGYRIYHWSHDNMSDWGKTDEYQRWLEEQGVDWPALRKRGNIPENLHHSTWCANKSIDFIQKESNAPWLLSANLFHPHAPFDVTAEAVRRFDIECLPGPVFRESDLEHQNVYFKGIDRGETAMRIEDIDPERLRVYQGVDLSDISKEKGKLFQAAHWACVELVDKQIGRILDCLKATGQRENTVVILHSDHGNLYGDHGQISSRCSFYEGSVHVPLVISWPGHFQRGLRAEGLVELIDIVPTLHDLLGLEITEKINGQSLLPVLTRQAPADHIKESVQSGWYFSFDDFSENLKGSYATMHRDERYKLCVYHGVEVGELYDMENDPNEFENLWDSSDYVDIKNRLIKQAFDHRMLAIDRGPRRISTA